MVRIILNNSIMITKVCTTCNKELPATKDNFNAQKNGRFGLRSICKPCTKIYRKQYTSTDAYKKVHRERQVKWRKDNPEKSLELSRKNYRKHSKRRNIERIEKYHTDPVFKAKVKERERRYKESGRRYEVQSTPEQREKAIIRSKKRRLNPKQKAHDDKRDKIWRENNKDKLRKMHTEYRENLRDSYVAHSMRVSVKDLTPDILETKRLIIKLKRELKNNNLKPI
jgi:hypothetical protein